jgi:hypothetical protein
MRWTKSCRNNARRDSLPRLFCSIFLALLSGGALAQETTLRSQSNVVLIPALVRDAQGAVVYGLEAKHFVVER